MRACLSLGVSALLVCACGDDVSGAGDGSTGSTTSTSTPTSSSTMTATTIGSSGSSATTNAVESSSGEADSSSDGGFEPTDPECGNGFVEAQEQCDDANDDDEDGCTSACEFQCGLQWASVQLAPTDQSQLDPRAIARGSNGNTAVVGFQREITTDQRGNETAEDDEAIVILFGEDGRIQWSLALSTEGSDVVPTGVAIDDADNIYVSATVAEVGNEDSDIHVFKLEPNREAALWVTMLNPGVDSSADESFDIALAPDGGVIVSGQSRAGDGDDDVYVARLDPDTGDEVWTSTWSGELAGGFSTDNGGPLAVGPAGEVYVFAHEYVNFESRLATLVRFGPDGGEAVSEYTPIVEGGQQNYLPLDVSTNAQGDVLITFVRLLAAGNGYYVARLDGGAEPEAWRIDTTPIVEAIADRGTSDHLFTAADFGADDSVVVSGSLERSAKGAAFVEPWVARLQGDATVRCQYVQPSPQLSLVPGSLAARALAVSEDDSALIAAQQIEDGVQALWVGSFRP